MTEQNPLTDPAALPELNDVSHVDDHTWPLKRAARNGVIAVAIIIVFSLMYWGAVQNTAGLWGALIGGVIGGGFMLMTVGVVLFTSNSTPTMTMGVVLGSWILKVAVILVIMLIIQDMTFYHRPALALTIVLAMVAALTTETYAVTKAQKLYVA